MRLQNTTEKQSELRDLLEENLKYTKEIWKISQKTRRYLVWVQVMDWIKVMLIVIPIILGIIYLPPLIEQWQAQIKEILDPAGSGGGSFEQLKDMKGILDLLKGVSPQN